MIRQLLFNTVTVLLQYEHMTLFITVILHFLFSYKIQIFSPRHKNRPTNIDYYKMSITFVIDISL